MIGRDTRMVAFCDLATSVFAIFFFVLASRLVLAGADASGQMPPAAEPKADAYVVERPVTSPDDMIRMLHQRVAPSARLSIALFTDRVEFVAGGDVTVLRGLQPATLRSVPVPSGENRIVVFVFSPRHYARLGRWLDSIGLEASELSVPDALRDPRHPGEAWRADFLGLEELRLSLPEFRRELARLLEGQEIRSRPGPAEVAGSASSGESGSRLSLQARAGRFLRMVAASLALAAVAVPMLWIERRRFRS